MKRHLLRVGFPALLVLATVSQLQAHDHIAAGIVDTNGIPGLQAGDSLAFVSGAISGTVRHLLPAPVGGKYGGYYFIDETPRAQFPTDSFSFIALSDGQTQTDGSNYARTGAYLWLEITSVTGPAGAHFGFWDENQASFRTTPNISFLTNSPTGGFKIEISEPLAPPPAPVGAITEPPGNLHYIISGATTALSIASDEDAYGHIHNRGWTVDQPGDYFVGFRLYDLSTNGPGGGPLHVPSQTFTMHFTAVPEPGSVALIGAGFVAIAMRRARRRC
jgi:PEP-CTERM motif